MGKHAIILGITGLTGNLLAQRLLDDPTYTEVVSFHRRRSGIDHPKLKEHIADMFSLEKEENRFKADVVFCCIGTTRSNTPDKEQYRKIDHGIPVSAARLCKLNHIPKLVVISALGSDPESRIFYNRIKGEMEQDVLRLNIPETYFLQPAVINGERSQKRPAESLFIKAFNLINPLLVGPLKKYRSIKGETIAKAMQILAETGCEKSRIPSDEIQKLVDEHAGD